MNVVGVEHAGGERDEHVVRVRVRGRHEALGLLDARMAEDVVIRRVSAHVEVASLLEARDGIGVVVDHHERPARLEEVPSDLFADPPEAADDVVILHRVEGFTHLSPLDQAKQVALDHELEEVAGREGEPAEARQDQRHGEDLSPGIQREDLAEAHRGNGDHGHVEGIDDGDVVEDPVSERAPDQHEKHDQQGETDLGERFHRACETREGSRVAVDGDRRWACESTAGWISWSASVRLG